MPRHPPDLGLGHVAVEAHQQDALLAAGQLTPVHGQRGHGQGVLHLRVLLAEQVGQAGRLRLAGQRRVQRGGLQQQVNAARLAHLGLGEAKVAGQFGVAGQAAELLSELADPLAELEQPFLQRPLHVHLPALVPEVPLDLAGDARLGVRGQAPADLRVEVVDGLEQAHVPHLHKVLGGLRAAPVAVRTGPDQGPVPADQHLTGSRPLGAAPRLRPDHAEQFVVRALLQVAGQVRDRAQFRIGVFGDPAEDGKCFHGERVPRSTSCMTSVSTRKFFLKINLPGWPARPGRGPALHGLPGSSPGAARPVRRGAGRGPIPPAGARTR